MRAYVLPLVGAVAVCGLNGCFWLVAGGAEAGYVAGQDDRKTGETVSDQWIHTKIISSFLAHSKVSARSIEVRVRKGIVTLKGSVASDEERDTALSLARSVNGVKKVVDKLSFRK